MSYEELDALCIEGLRDCLSHPLTRRFAQQIAATGNNKIYAPSQVLGERLMRIGGMLIAMTEDPKSIRMNIAYDPAQQLRALLLFARASLTSSAYLWSERVRVGMRSSFPRDESGRMGGLPRHVISARILPEPRMWWTFETAVGLADEEEHGTDLTVDAMCIEDQGDGFMVYEIGEITDAESRAQTGGAQPFLRGAQFAYGSRYPDDYGEVGDPHRVTLESVLSMLAFLNSPFIPKDRQRLTRPERRELKRLDAPGGDEEVSFINLRRPEESRRPSESGDGGTDWKHSWLVSGHYRAHWYPKEQAHHVIWIAPHLKGPADAPLLEHAYRVVR